MNETFVDASFWIAVTFPRDQHHIDGMLFWATALQRDRPTVTTNWTLYEAVTFLNGKDRHDLALQALEMVERTTTIVDAAEFEGEAVRVFPSHHDKRWSVVDCASFVCIRERGTRLALAFDNDFAQAQTEFDFELVGVGAAE